MSKLRVAVVATAFALVALGAYESWAASACGQSTSGPNKVCTTCGCSNAPCTATTTNNKCVQGNASSGMTQYVACHPATDGEPHTCQETYANPPLTCTLDICTCTNPQPPPNPPPNPPPPPPACSACAPGLVISVPNTCTST